jgi:hypothetical protein
MIRLHINTRRRNFKHLKIQTVHSLLVFKVTEGWGKLPCCLSSMWYFSKLTRNWFLFLIIYEKREWKYWEGSGKISKLKNNFLQQSLRLQPIMILIFFFWNLTIVFILSVSVVEWMGSIKFCWECEFHYWAMHGTSRTFPYPKLVTDTKMAQDSFKTGPDFRQAFHILAVNTRSYFFNKILPLPATIPKQVTWQLWFIW